MNEICVTRWLRAGYMKSSFPKGVRSILESSEKNDVFKLSMLGRLLDGTIPFHKRILS